MRRTLIMGIMLLLIASSANATDFTDRNIVFYAMDNPAANIVVDEADFINATNNGGIFSNDGTAEIVTLDGTDYIIADAGDVLGTKMTACIWFSNDGAIGTEAMIARRFTTNNRQWQMLMTAGGGIGINFYDGGTTPRGAITSNNTFTNGAWHQACLVQLGNTATLYVDKKNNGVDNTAGKVSDTNIYEIGSVNGGGNPSYSGNITGVGVWSIDFNSSLLTEIYDEGRGFNPYDITPPPVISNQSLEKTSVINQVGSVNIASASYTNVLNGTFNISNATFAVGSWTVEIDNRQVTDVTCRGLIDGDELGTETNRTFSANNQLASLLLFSMNKTVDPGEHWAAIQCKKNAGPSFFTVSNTNTIIHVLNDAQGDNISFITNTFSVSLNSSSFVNLGSFNFTTSNKTTGVLNLQLVFEGSINYNYVSESNITFFAQVGGINTPGYTRYGEANSDGSGGGLYIRTNVSPNTNVSFTLFGKSTSADGGATVNMIVKEFLTHENETGISNSTGTVITNSWSIIEMIDINNSDHANANLVSKSVNSYESLVGPQEISLMLGNDIINGTVITRSIDDAKPGVVLLQEVFQNIGVGQHNVYLWGITSSGNAIVNNGSTIAYITDNIAFISTIYEVRAFDAWDNTSISVFNVTNQEGTIFNTTEGIVNVTPTGATDDLTTQADNYFLTQTNGHSVINNLNVSLRQSWINFTAEQIVTNITLSDVTFTVTDGVLISGGDENTTFFLKAGNYNVTASKAGYFDRIVSFNVTALDNKTILVPFMSDTIINFTAQEFFTNNTINSFSISNDLVGSFATTNGFIEVPAIQGTPFTFNASSTGYSSLTFNVTANANIFNHTITFFTFNSVRINIYNTTTGNKLLQNVTIDVISAITSFTNVTNTSTIIIDLLQPNDYELRFSSEGFNPRSAFITVSNDSTQELNIIMTLNNTNSQQIVFVNDLSSKPVETAVVFLQQQFINQSPQWVTIQEAETDFSGRTVVYVERDSSVFYRFLVKFDDEFKPISPNNNLFTSKTIFLPGVVENIFLIINIEGEIDDFITDLLGISTSLVYSNNNNTITYSWADPNNAIVGGRMIVRGKYLVTNSTFSTVFDSQVNSVTGNISYTFIVQNNTIYEIDGLIVWTNNNQVYQSSTRRYDIDVLINKNAGLLYAAIILLVVALLTYTMGPLVSALLAALSLFVSVQLGLLSWGITLITTLIAIIVIAFIKIKSGK